MRYVVTDFGSGFIYLFILIPCIFIFYRSGGIFTSYDLNVLLQLKLDVLSGRKIQANKFCNCMNKQGKI